MSDIWLAAHQALTLTLDLLYRQNESKFTQMAQAEHHGKKNASAGYLIVTSGILEDVISDKNRVFVCWLIREMPCASVSVGRFFSRMC